MDAFICDATRTPIGRYGGALSSVRADDLAATPIAALMARNPSVDWASVDDVIYGSANQAAKTTATSRAWPRSWRACPSTCRAHCEPPLRFGMDAVGMAARGIKRRL